ncbi:unnamed protein product [Amoebophrya sp. A25]|nr:unnamed protein product [Amoebophrya sp. A25]|eukprot:GSA25T00004696001.1
MQWTEIGNAVEFLFAWSKFKGIVIGELKDKRHTPACNPQTPTQAKEGQNLSGRGVDQAPRTPSTSAGDPPLGTRKEVVKEKIRDAIRNACAGFEWGEPYASGKVAADTAAGQLLKQDHLSCAQLIAATNEMEFTEIGGAAEFLYAWVQFKSVVLALGKEKHSPACHPQTPTQAKDMKIC